MEQTNNTAPQGKGLGVTGFVLSLIGLVGYFPIAVIVAAQAMLGGGYGTAIFWLVLCLAGTILSAMGMMKLGKTGGKRGLAITGLILGIVALLLSAWLTIGISKIQAASSQMQDAFGADFQKAMDDAKASADSSMNAQ
ncbi:MAG: hypothetical protein K0S33_172 [Bacteroidetes bacterium]|jgi:hypothetical protein|nr:hypothetical protein [Bacteroidota bacterium]